MPLRLGAESYVTDTASFDNVPLTKGVDNVGSVLI